MIIPEELRPIEEKIYYNKRLTSNEGLKLFYCGDINVLGYLANMVRETKNKRKTYYIVNTHLNYSNICKNKCLFCAFSKEQNQQDAYFWDIDQINEKLKEIVTSRTSEIHLVGGLHPNHEIDWYCNLLKKLSDNFPDCHLQAFTAVEIFHIAKISNISVFDCLKQLKECGLGSLPGGGAEIFDEKIRKEICPEKISGKQWLKVMQTAHELGIKSNATMLYGHIESYEDRINHLISLRDLQDQTKGFMSFIPLKYHPQNTKLGGKKTSAIDDLKTIAVSRMMLDNFDHIKSFWIMLGVNLAQISLNYGADDLDGTVEEEKITHAAGAETPQKITEKRIVHLIKEAGFEPVRRDTVYNILD